jgi:DNA-binding SARP family transcriptional activator/TolB-like protein
MLRLRLFGNPVVLDGETPVAGAAAQPRRLALLALLAASDGALSREKLIGILWPEVEQERARRNLTHALYALRRDLGDEETLQGAKDLRLAPDRISSDVAEFEAALAEGRLAEAAELYAGPFLDGFHVPGVEEFERWVEARRSAYAHRFAEALETLAARAVKAGRHREAVASWRKLAALDPLNVRYCVGLMESLSASGDPAGALRHARVFEELVRQDLGVAPDARVTALAERLRRQPAAPAATAPPDRQAMPAAGDEASADGPARAEPSASAAARDPVAAPSPEVAAPRVSAARAPRRAASRRLGFAAVALLVVLGAGARRIAGRPAPSDRPVLAVGGIVDRRTGTPAPLADALADMLATNLARAEGVRVVSGARMTQLVQGLDAGSPSAAYLAAAGKAGAGEVVEGVLYDLGEGRLRLDLRRVALPHGELRQALTVQGADPFALADSGTARILAALGAARLPGPLAEVTTNSIAAWQLYRAGMRLLHGRWDGDRASPLFRAALEADSTFALAAYYYAVSDPRLDTPARTAALRRAARLAEHATTHDRLLIRQHWAQIERAPEFLAFADSLVRLFPQEAIGHQALGAAYTHEGDFLRSLAPYERAVALDSAFLGTEGEPCVACTALDGLVGSYLALDSLDAAERSARRWRRLQPRSLGSHNSLSEVLAIRERYEEALAQLDSAEALDPSAYGVPIWRARVLIRAGRGAEAERVLQRLLEARSEHEANAVWHLALAAREQGKLDEALAQARRYRDLWADGPRGDAAPPHALLEGAIRLDRGEYARAAAVFDSVSRWPAPDITPGQGPTRLRRGSLVHVATALYLDGDTVRLPRLADSIAHVEPGAARQDVLLAHYARGLVLASRGAWAEAERELRDAMYSRTHGYTRVNTALAEVLARQGRTAEARALLETALRSPLDSRGLYVSHRELRRLRDATGPGTGPAKPASP